MKLSFFKTRKTRKAQSATEYLMTYGWAILAIAIVGALLYTQVFSTKKCAEGANGFPMAGGVSVSGNQFTVNSAGDIQVKLRNNLDDAITITALNSQTTVTGTPAIAANSEEVVAGATAITAGASGTCYSAETLTITYTVTDGITGMTSSGTISGRYA